ncbi:MAG TPA: hypothetical protein VGD29_17145, partial [Actinoplanes sp.]
MAKAAAEPDGPGTVEAEASTQPIALSEAKVPAKSVATDSAAPISEADTPAKPPAPSSAAEAAPVTGTRSAVPAKAGPPSWPPKAGTAAAPPSWPPRA